MPRLRYYISGHGLGHASRSCQVLSALHELYPEIIFDVVSSAPRWFMDDNLPAATPIEFRELDVGVVQVDSLQMHPEQTLAACRALIASSTQLLNTEAAALQSDRIDLVVTDVAALPCLAARRAGCPAVILSNFTWDWIYEAFADDLPGFHEVISWHRNAYSEAALALRLPFHGPLDQPPRQIDLPLIARLGMQTAEAVRQQLGIPDGQRLGLLSFGGFGLEQTRLASLTDLTDWIFLADGPLAGQADNLRPLPAGCSYPDLVKAADVVITKPGYGIVAECIANRTPVLYTSRGNFREQELLIEGLQRYNRSAAIDNTQLRNGDWRDSLERLLRQPETGERIALNGAEVAARQLADMLPRQEAG